MEPNFLSILKFFDAKLEIACEHGNHDLGLLVSEVLYNSYSFNATLNKIRLLNFILIISFSDNAFN